MAEIDAMTYLGTGMDAYSKIKASDSEKLKAATEIAVARAKANTSHYEERKSESKNTNIQEVGEKLFILRQKETEEKYKADQIKAKAHDKLVNDYIKGQEMNREEKRNFLRLLEMGVYYIHNGKIQIDSKKFQELQYLNNSNTKFDKKVERKAYKKYNKYAQKRFGHLTYHGSPEEERIKNNDPVTYSQIEYDKDRFMQKYKAKYEKKRQRYIKKQFKKKYRFNKWKNKKGYTL